MSGQGPPRSNHLNVPLSGNVCKDLQKIFGDAAGGHPGPKVVARQPERFPVETNMGKHSELQSACDRDQEDRLGLAQCDRDDAPGELEEGKEGLQQAGSATRVRAKPPLLLVYLLKPIREQEQRAARSMLGRYCTASHERVALLLNLDRISGDGERLSPYARPRLCPSAGTRQRRPTWLPGSTSRARHRPGQGCPA
jgi:hypothetical protein